MSLPEVSPEFEALLEYLKHDRGCDLTGYKRTSLMRRFQHRMQQININDYQSYLRYLQSHAEECRALLDEVLINVTNFFRDRDVWDYLTTDILPKLIAQKSVDEPIRVWSAGCAAGQEIYSILILLAEALGIEACGERVQCFATDIDEAALQQARQGIYSDRDITGISPDLLEKYFELTKQGYVFHSALRRKIIFGRHDLATDAPMSKIDLLMCRNVMIYFTPTVQTSLLVRFHFALRNTGFLCLGRSEAMIHHRQIFTPISLKHRVFAKGLNLELEDHLAIHPKSRLHQDKQNFEAVQQPYFWKTAFEKIPVAQLLIDRNGCLIGANERANLLFQLTIDDLHCAIETLEPGKLLSAHGSGRILQRRPTTFKHIKWETAEGTTYFEVAIVPVFNAKNWWLGSTLTFLEVHQER